ncbi:MAG: molybdopterin molybdotransferase MoeA [Paracoccaceae bacterium]|nr:molybdopterin molybdotransferase MoeA [Paracoccaceae bacterium]
MISVAEALAHILALMPRLDAETVPLAQAAHRVLAEPAIARRDQPPFDASAMDGYAVQSAEALPGATFRVVGESAAGHGFAGQLQPGQAVRIFTGAPVPMGAECVLLQEDMTRDGDLVTLTGNHDGSRNIRAKGADFRAGDRFDAPRLIHPHDVALMAAMNIAELRVTRRPVVALIATGDELVMPGEAPRPDQIVASNTFALAALLRAEGAEARMLPIAPDTRAGLAAVFGMAQDADLIVTIGGASVGDHDLVADVATELGLQRAFYKVAMRPGKPLMAGRMGGAAMLGLPGNPVSAIVCGHLFVLPAVRAMLGLPDPAPRLRRAVLAEPVGANGPRAHYMRALVSDDDSAGLPNIQPFAQQDSALLGLLSRANALMLRPPHDAAQPKGAEVRYLSL